MKIKIKEPIWKDESVGIKRDLICDDIEMEIEYKDRHGNKVFPFIYTMPYEKALGYPVLPARGHVPALVNIPIKDFDIKT